MLTFSNALEGFFHGTTRASGQLLIGLNYVGGGDDRLSFESIKRRKASNSHQMTSTEVNNVRLQGAWNKRPTRTASDTRPKISALLLYTTCI